MAIVEDDTVVSYVFQCFVRESFYRILYLGCYVVFHQVSEATAQSVLLPSRLSSQLDSTRSLFDRWEYPAAPNAQLRGRLGWNQEHALEKCSTEKFLRSNAYQNADGSWTLLDYSMVLVGKPLNSLVVFVADFLARLVLAPRAS